jgi:hypothetical protein
MNTFCVSVSLAMKATTSLAHTVSIHYFDDRSKKDETNHAIRKLLGKREIDKVSISSTFYERLLCQKITEPKCNWRKAAQSTFIQKIESKMLMKLTQDVNFINILQATFGANFFAQKNYKAKL